MKFRYKVLFTNLILLSLGLGLVGYLMIHKNFELAKQTQLKNAIVRIIWYSPLWSMSFCSF